MFRPIENLLHVKPDGGLWASPYTPKGEFISSWHEWCYYNQPEWIKNDAVILTLKSDAKIYIIDCLRDFEILCENIGFLNFLDLKFLKFLDFEKASTMYDAIFLTARGQRETRYSIPYSLYGWDCESILIMNYDIIDNWCYERIDFLDVKNIRNQIAELGFSPDRICEILESNLVGYCEECGSPVHNCDEIKDYAGVYECPKCKHPHAKDELWDEVPYYIK
jgi:predicted RNA-binding Zn-ribbon protein involved in translation (DUF1610 family)